MSDLFDKYHIEGLEFPVVIHHFKGPEPEDAEPHDHPFDFTTFIMKGGYTETIHRTELGHHTFDFIHEEGCSHKVEATDIHLITKMSEGGCFTLMLPGEKVREPGFWKFDESGAHFRQHDSSEFKLK